MFYIPQQFNTLIWRALILIGCILYNHDSFAEKNKQVTIAMGEFPPFTGKELPDYGCASTLYRMIFESQGYQVEFFFMPWEKAYLETQTGKFNATGHWLDQPKRRANFLFPKQHVAVEVLYFYYHKDFPLNWQSFSDLKKRRLIINSGFTYNDAFYRALNKYKIKYISVAEMKKNFPLLLKERGDTTLMNEASAKVYIEQVPFYQKRWIVKHRKPAIISKGYLLFSKMNKGSQKLIKDFDQGFNDVMSDLEFYKLYLENCSKL